MERLGTERRHTERERVSEKTGRQTEEQKERGPSRRGWGGGASGFL